MRVNIRRRLQGAFALIALAALGIALSNYLQYRRLEGDARAINLAGSQRYRTYRLAMLAARAPLESGADAAIEEELARFRAVHRALRDGDRAAGVKPPPTWQAAVILDAVSERFEAFERLIRARADPQGPAIPAAATELAGLLDEATNEFERASAVAVARDRQLQLGLLVATAALIAVSFAEMHRTVLRRLPALEAALHELAHGHRGAEVHLGRAPEEVERLEAAFNEMSHEIERADAMKSQFIANMSHELRTPLTSVIGFAQHLRDGLYGPLTPKQVDRVDAILRNARHLLALISDILDLAKIEAGKLDIVRERVALGDLVREVAADLHPLADAKRLPIEVAVAGDLPAVETDPARVRQILYNLVANAIKFTERGKVRIAAEPATPSGGVRIAVEDTGIGIAKSDLDRLFRRFEQIDGSGTRRHGGAGLGLHVSKRLADLLGARIEVESEPGRGSRFALVLPGEPGFKEEEPCRPPPPTGRSESSSSTTIRTS